MTYPLQLVANCTADRASPIDADAYIAAREAYDLIAS